MDERMHGNTVIITPTPPDPHLSAAAHLTARGARVKNLGVWGPRTHPCRFSTLFVLHSIHETKTHPTAYFPPGQTRRVGSVPILASPPDIGEATCMCVSCMLRAPAHGTPPKSEGSRRTHQSWTTMKKSGTRTRNRSRNRATQLFEFPPRCLEWPPFWLSFCTCQIAARYL